MVLKKPSEYFKKEITSVDETVQEMVKMPELNTFSDAFESFKSNLNKIEVLSEFSETLDNYRVNIERVNFLSERIEDIQTEIQTLIKKEDLDRVMMSQLIVVEQSIRDLQSKVKGINEKNLTEIRLDVVGLTETVSQFLDVEVPKYKKLVLDTEIRSEKICNKLSEKVNSTVTDILDRINSVETINIDTIDDVKILQDNVSIELQNLNEYKEELNKKSLDLRSKVIFNETQIKTQNEYIDNVQQEVTFIRNVIQKLPIEKLEERSYELSKKIEYFEEVFEKFNTETLTEGLLNDPPEIKNTDPLTPLDKNFVTIEQLQEHYRLFINRIQQQLATIGGGGETRLKYLDDIVGIATNASAYDGKFLKYNHGAGNFEFVTVSGGGGGSGETYWSATNSGIHTLSNVAIGTTEPQSALDVRGAITVGVGTVGINSIFSTTDIAAWNYTGKFKLVTGDDTSPQAVYIGAAGTAMFVVGDTNNRIIQYTLSTPYDVSTAGAAVTFVSTASQDTVTLGLDFNPTGTKMFVSGNTGVAPLIAGGDYVHEYSLSTPWNVSPSSVVYTSSYNVTQDSDPQGVAFGSSGSKMYVVGNTNNAIYQYSLSTPYSLASGVTYDNKSLAVGTVPGEATPTDISFKSDGTVLWIIGSSNDRIYEFRLGTAWDISTAVFYDDVYVGFNETSPAGLHVIPEQNVAYVIGSGSDTVFQYSTNTPALEIASSGIQTNSSIILNNETRVKDDLYVKGNAYIDNALLVQSNSQFDGTGNFSSNLTHTGTTATLNNTTSANTVNISTGAVTSGNQKTINVGTGGVSGSRLLVTFGSATAGTISTVACNFGTNLILGLTTPSPTGTSLQPLQVGSASSVQGAYISGSIGIGTTNPSSRLSVIGDALIVGVITATDFNSASDVKLKNNVSVIDNPIDKIIKLEGVNFSWKETGKKSLGVIAQEVEKVLPELVSGDQIKTVNYNGIIGLLIECVKHQQKEIEELKIRVDK